MESWKLHAAIGEILFREVSKSSDDYARAEAQFHAAKRLAAAIQGEESSLFTTSLSNLAGLLQDQGKFDEARRLYERTIAIDEKTLGAEHPNFATRLNNLADLLQDLGNFDETKPLYERAIAIYEKKVGAEHPSFATRLNNSAGLLQALGSFDDVERLCERVFAITEETLGAEPPDLAQEEGGAVGMEAVQQMAGMSLQRVHMHSRSSHRARIRGVLTDSQRQC